MQHFELLLHFECKYGLLFQNGNESGWLHCHPQSDPRFKLYFRHFLLLSWSQALRDDNIFVLNTTSMAATLAPAMALNSTSGFGSSLRVLVHSLSLFLLSFLLFHFSLNLCSMSALLSLGAGFSGTCNSRVALVWVLFL